MQRKKKRNEVLKEVTQFEKLLKKHTKMAETFANIIRTGDSSWLINQSVNNSEKYKDRRSREKYQRELTKQHSKIRATDLI